MNSSKGSKKLGEYIKSLRLGYGYSLRTIEEKAKNNGQFLDNSQLSRYEQGTCFPSFDKLRVLAEIFSVSIQNFSDVLELEKFDKYKDESKGYSELMNTGHTAFKAGNYVQAYALYESAISILNKNGQKKNFEECMGKARCSKAIALEKLGKLGLAEHELRTVLKTKKDLSSSILILVLMELAKIHVELGEIFLASLEAKSCHEMALDENDLRSCAFALHLLGNIASENNESGKAITFFTEAKKIHEKYSNKHEIINLDINIGSRLIASERFKEGILMIKRAIKASEESGFRRSTAYGFNKLAEAYFDKGDYKRAKVYIKKSDARSETSEEKYVDIKFLNAFYSWKIALEENDEIAQRLCFGRLKFFRKSLERRFPEVEEFDAYIERRQKQ
jgi:tetratricopeptide (TPR) repeat protein